MCSRKNVGQRVEPWGTGLTALTGYSSHPEPLEAVYYLEKRK